MTTENQYESTESKIVDGALQDEEMNEEQLESVAGGAKKRVPRLKNAAAAAEIANNAHQIYKR